MREFGSRTELQLVALIGDVVSSRDSRERPHLQRRLVQGVGALNDQFRNLHVPIALTSGDEVQALLVQPEQAVDLIVGLSEAIFPARIVFGLGYGPVTSGFQPEVALMDGPCFHRARAALEEVRGDHWVIARGFGSLDDAVLTSLFSLMGALRSRWTETQLRYLQSARTASQKEVAREWSVSPSTVSESLKAAAFGAVQEGEAVARDLLARFGYEAELSVNSVGEPK